jgi:AcrR family transcriptional regulator
MAVKESTPHGAAVELAILDAARDLLADRGPEALSMRAVAERVGVSATAIYHYFENKEALVRRVVDHGFERFGDSLREAAERHPRGSLERVRALGEAYLQFAIENEAYFRVLFDVHHAHQRALDDLPDNGGYGLLRQAVEDAMAAGTIRKTDPDVLVMYLWSLAHGLLMISMTCNIDRCPEFGPSGTGRAPVDLFRAFAPFVREGIAQPGPRANATAANEDGGDA